MRTAERTVRLTRASVGRRTRGGAGGRGPGDDSGSAVVEFLGVTLLLLVPVVYLVLVLGRLQAAAFAVDGAAREAVRVAVAATSDSEAGDRAVAAVGLALQDQGFPSGAATDALSLACAAEPCLTADATITATVAIDVDLPLVPGWLQDVVPLSIPVSGDATGRVDTFVGRR